MIEIALIFTLTLTYFILLTDMHLQCYFQNRDPEYTHLNDETGNNESRNENSFDENTTIEDSNSICDQI